MSQTKAKRVGALAIAGTVLVLCAASLAIVTWKTREHDARTQPDSGTDKNPNDDGKGHETEEHHNRGVNRCREGERSDEAPSPLRRRQRATAESGTADGLQFEWWASAACPPQIKGEEYRFGHHSQRHAKAQEKQRPHICSGESNYNAGDDGPQQHGQLRPPAMCPPLRCHRHCSLLRLFDQRSTVCIRRPADAYWLSSDRPSQVHQE